MPTEQLRACLRGVHQRKMSCGKPLFVKDAGGCLIYQDKAWNK